MKKRCTLVLKFQLHYFHSPGGGSAMKNDNT